MARTPNPQPDNPATLDLTRYCLEPDPAESRRPLAWVNSICLMFLVVGLIGLKPRTTAVTMRPPVAEEAVPTVIEPLVPEVQIVTANDTPETASAGDQAPADSGPAVAVTLDSPAVAFSVPTVGNLLVPLPLAQAPPPRPMQAVAALPAPHIERIGVTAITGSRPPPPYPEDSLRRLEQGTVVLFLEVDEAGQITSVVVKESSGHQQLDRSSLEYIRHHWHFEPAPGRRQYEAPIVFRISNN